MVEIKFPYKFKGKNFDFVVEEVINGSSLIEFEITIQNVSDKVREFQYSFNENVKIICFKKFTVYFHEGSFNVILKNHQINFPELGYEHNCIRYFSFKEILKTINILESLDKEIENHFVKGV